MLDDISDLIAYPAIFFILTKYQNLHVCCRIIFIIKVVLLGHCGYLNLITNETLMWTIVDMVEAL